MESTPSSGSETTAPLVPDTAPTSPDLSWVRSRRVHTFALGALVGALGLSLVVVVSTIFAAAQNPPAPLPAAPAPVSEVRTTPRPTPTPAPTPAPTAEATDETTDAPVEEAPTTEPVVAPAPAPTPSEPPVEADDSSDPGQSGSAPGRTKAPKKP